MLGFLTTFKTGRKMPVNNVHRVVAEPLSPACKGMSQVTSMSHIFLGHFNYLKLLLIFYINCNNPINNVSE